MAAFNAALEKAARSLRTPFRDFLVSSYKKTNLTNNTKISVSCLIHPSSVVHENVYVDEDTVIGPFCHIGDGVVLGSGCRILSHVFIQCNTIVGDKATLYPFASVGADPQDLKYRPDDLDKSWLVLGAGSIVRENATIHRGTAQGGGITTIGRSCLIMTGAHVSLQSIFLPAASNSPAQPREHTYSAWSPLD